MMRITPMVKNILIINVVIALVQGILNLPLNDWMSLRVVFSDEFAPWQFFTYMWLHDTNGFWHLLGNMFAVFIFGPMIEQAWGAKRFLTFYLICGIGAGVLYGVVDFVEKLPLKNDAEAYMANPNPEDFRLFILDYKVHPKHSEELIGFSDRFYEYPENRSLIEESVAYVRAVFNANANGSMVGASGAVFGILMAFGMLFPNTQLMLLFPPIPVRAKYIVFFYGAYELYSEFSRRPDDNVAHLAHLGGMLIAFILIKYWARNGNRLY
ncbi:MAG: rhomboid family intramembrane serine protease [Cyclobacteriaceae bacterium]